MNTTRRKKLLLATPIYYPDIGGPATYTKELSERLGQDYEISILTYGDNDSPTFPNTRMYFVNKNLRLPVRLFLYFLKSLKYVWQSDVVYVQNAVASGLPIALSCLVLKRKFVLKFVGDEAWERTSQAGLTKKFLEEFLDQPEGNWKTKIFLAIQRFTLRRAEIVTTPSKYLGLAIQKAYKLDARKVKTNYNASEENDVQIAHNEKKSHQILATARLTKFKGIDSILQAVKILKVKYQDISFVVCGDGPELENLRKLSIDLDIESHVKFLGKVTREETFKLRKESSVYVLNSTYEGLPHTALTCFQARIPIVATNIPGTNEAVYDNVSGLLCEPNNPTDLAEKISTLFEDKSLADKLVDGGTKILHEKFSWKSHLNNLKSFFDSLN